MNEFSMNLNSTVSKLYFNVLGHLNAFCINQELNIILHRCVWRDRGRDYNFSDGSVCWTRAGGSQGKAAASAKSQDQGKYQVLAKTVGQQQESGCWPLHSLLQILTSLSSATTFITNFNAGIGFIFRSSSGPFHIMHEKIEHCCRD